MAEAKAQNNHGTWYDVQAASLALFTGQQEIAKAVLKEFSAKRIIRQIDPDGRQPRELARTRSWHYSVFNLEAFFNAAAVGEKVGIDLWNNRSGDDRDLRNALDWLIPFATGARKWTHKQLSPFQPEKLAPLLQQAAFRYREPAYLAAVAKLPRITGNERWRLLYTNRTKPAG